VRSAPSFYSGRKVFVTGHTGFKGSWLCLWLHQLGAKVTGYALDPPTEPNLNFSSGAVYGTDFVSSGDDRSQAIFGINPIDPAAYYGIAKLHSETRHRAMKDYRIVDLRVFGYFSRFIDLNAKYMMSEVISCTKFKKEFKTGSDDIVRDYIHPEDLAALVKLCIEKHGLNNAFDVASVLSVRKFEILEKFFSLYGLRYTIEERHDSVSVTGRKANFYSTNNRIQAIGFSPRFTSMASLLEESKTLLKSY